MSKLSKKVMASLSLALSAVLVFSACSKTGNENQSPKTTADTSAPDKVHKLKILGKNSFGKYVKWDDRGKFPQWKLYEEQLKKRNLELEYDFVEPEQYKTVIQTRLAAAVDLPDIMEMGDVDDMTALNLGKSGTLVELNEAIKKYSDGTINDRYEKKFDFSKKVTTTSDGKRYWFASAVSWSNLIGDDGKEVKSFGIIGQSIRKDWLDKLKLPMPKTVDEWKSALKAFRDKDVNGNGAKDEVIVFDSYSYSFFSGIAQWFGLVPDITGYDPISNKITTPWYQPGAKEYFKLMSELAKEGIFDVGLVGAKDEAINQKIAENKVGGKRGYAVDSYSENLIKGVAEAEYMLLSPLTAKSGVTPLVMVERSDALTFGKYAITKGCKDVEGAIKLFDYIFSDDFTYVKNFGVEGTDYNIVNGKPEKIEEKLTLEELYNKTRGSLGFFVGNFFPRLEGYITVKQKTVKESLELSANDKVRRGNERKFELVKYPNQIATTGSSTVYSLPTPEENETVNKYMTALKTYSEELAMSLILGTQSIDNWDAHIKKLKDLGLDKVLEVNQARYERFMKAK